MDIVFSAKTHFRNSAEISFDSLSPEILCLLAETPKHLLEGMFRNNREEITALVHKHPGIYRNSEIMKLIENEMEEWEELALIAMKYLENAGFGGRKWSVGGGTALMRTLRHRKSRDVDIFIDDPQLLAMVSPRLNDIPGYPECDYIEQANFTKIQLPMGEIDFILAATVTSMPVKHIAMAGYSIPYEHPYEVMAKKIRYRGENFTPRDVFDLAALWKTCGMKMIEKLELNHDDCNVLDRRLAILKDSGIEIRVDAMPGWESLCAESLDLCKEFCSHALEMTGMPKM